VAENRNEGDDSQWLSAHAAAWAASHAYVLREVFLEFERTGEWPDPVQLERQLRASGKKIRLVGSLATMPPEIGWREHHEPRVVLTLFGLGCVREARPLLQAYLNTLQLALARYDNPPAPNRLSRADVVDLLDLSERDADRLSSLLVASGNPFLAGGTIGVQTWDLGIDERIVDFENVATVDDLLETLAKRQGLVHPAAQTLSVATQAPSAGHAEVGVAAPSGKPDEGGLGAPILGGPAVVLLWVLTLGANVLTVIVAPLPFGITLIVASIAAAVGHRHLVPPSVSVRVAAIVVAAATGAGALTWFVTRDAPEDQRTAAQHLDDDLAKAAREHRHTVYHQIFALHPGADQSHLLVIRDDRLRDKLRTDLAAPNSDEIRIYDVQGADLVHRFTFRPQDAGTVRQEPEGDHPAFQFRIYAVKDYDKNGKPEIVGAFERFTLATGALPVPVVVAWDEGESEYRIEPLIRKAPHLRPDVGVGLSSQAAYTRPTPIRDQLSGKVVRGYATDVYELRTGSRAAILSAGYAAMNSSASGPLGYAVLGWWIDFQTPIPAPTACYDGFLTPPAYLQDVGPFIARGVHGAVKDGRCE
jgi:hypothetical protein